MSLIEMIQSPPSAEDEHNGEEQTTQVEQLVFGSTRQGCLSRQAFGYLLAWSSMLQKIDEGRVKSQIEQRDDYQAVLGAISDFLERKHYIYEMFLVIVLSYLPKQKRVQVSVESVANFDPVQMDLDSDSEAILMSLHCLVGFMKSFPSLARRYFQGMDKRLLDIVMPYLKQVVNPAILENEILKIEVS